MQRFQAYSRAVIRRKKSQTFFYASCRRNGDFFYSFFSVIPNRKGIAEDIFTTSSFISTQNV